VEQPNATAEEKRNRGCLFYGCLTLSILTVVALVFAGTGLYFGYRNLSTKLDDIADTKPADLRVEVLGPEQLLILHKKIDRFLDATSTGVPVEPLTLDSGEINSLIQTDEKFRKIREHIKVEVVGEKIKASISMPLELFNRPDQYFNGTATVHFVESEHGTQLYIDALESKGKSVPETALILLRQTDLLMEARKSPESKALIEQLDRIQVKNGRIILYGKAATPS
jgi:hypothetical protein